MKIKSLQLFIKQKKIKIEQLGLKMAPLRQKLQRLQQLQKANETKIRELRDHKAHTILEMQLSSSLIHSLQKQNQQIQHTIENIQQNLTILQKELQEVFGQKKALEKLLQRTKDLQTQKRTKEESRIADENYLRKTHSR